MTTYTDHQQRRLDAASGAEMDRRARKAPDANHVLRRMLGVPYTDALVELCCALAAEYSRGRADGAREVGGRLAQTRGDTGKGPAGLTGNTLGGVP